MPLKRRRSRKALVKSRRKPRKSKRTKRKTKRTKRTKRRRTRRRRRRKQRGGACGGPNQTPCGTITARSYKPVAEHITEEEKPVINIRITRQAVTA